MSSAAIFVWRFKGLLFVLSKIKTEILQNRFLSRTSCEHILILDLFHHETAEDHTIYIGVEGCISTVDPRYLDFGYLD